MFGVHELSVSLLFKSQNVGTNDFIVKVMSHISFLFCFMSVKESTVEIRKNVFHFISKALVIIEMK